ncbi:ABC transporter ATP-binding protein [Natronoglycomyces albus]|uniref:ATP-binding cassette domain-containing protein n=1 Tax=Natronoglycomyces albus TaxID=2811108 RepID=A0A895XT31_9ACTN|nr:ATP-binding cassette domain-containing protein [Natronoglycomyces albus]QSB05696.1 ATP-binding cassette domain-containing protein [Natronoglycomyces albus]
MLEVSNLHKRFGDVVALDGVSFSIKPGELTGFVGANGAGKTTTMRIMMGVLNNDSGEVVHGGKPVVGDMRTRWGYMPEERGLYPKMKVAEQIAYFGQLHGMSPADAKSATADLLEQLELTARAKDDVQDLSLGNQQRVQLAVSLVHTPEVLVLDEPFSGLDPLAVDVMAESLKRRASSGVPVLFSSHQLELMERICDSVVIISGGKIIAKGTVEQLRSDAVKQLRLNVETSADLTDVLPGTVTRDGDDYLVADAPDSQAVLAAAQAAGPINSFGYDRPSLAEIFREVVAK